eukprot:1934110-Prymnesium_polylepis.1
MISGVSSQPPRWIFPAERQRASCTHVKQKAAQRTRQRHPAARDPNDAPCCYQPIHFDDIVFCWRVG